MSSEILGEDVPLIYINNLFDTDKDGIYLYWSI